MAFLSPQFIPITIEPSKERGKGKGMQIAAHAHETIPRQLSEIICYKTEIDC